jgi:hypothetical protein
VIKILCHKCKKEKVRYHFRGKDRDSKTPICINCQDDFKLNNMHGIKQEKELRVCTGCREPFYSVNGARFCKRCKDKIKRNSQGMF